MKKAKDMDAVEVINAIHCDSPLAKTRRLLAQGMARIEQADMQHKSISPVERRRMELEIAQDIMALFIAVS